MNQVQMVGRISTEPKLSSTSNGIQVLNFDVECQERWVDKSGVLQSKSQYHQIVQYGKMAKLMSDELRKDDFVSITGSLWTSIYEQQGEKKYRTQVKANTIEVIGGASYVSEESKSPF